MFFRDENLGRMESGRPMDSHAWLLDEPARGKGGILRRIACALKGEEYDPCSEFERRKRLEQEEAERLAEINRRFREQECARVRDLMKEAARCAPGEPCPAFDEIKAEWDERYVTPAYSKMYGLAYAYVQAQRSACCDNLDVSRELMRELDGVWRFLEYSDVSREVATCYAEALLDLFNREESLEERNRICTVLEELEDASPVPEVELILRNVCRCLNREEKGLENGQAELDGVKTSGDGFVIVHGVRVGFDGPGGYKAFLRQGRDERELARYSGPGGTVRIPDGVTAIDIGAFKDRADVEEVLVPDSVKAIYKYAFTGCTNLRTIKGCKGLVYVGERVFPDCPNLWVEGLPKELSALLSAAEERELYDNGLDSRRFPRFFFPRTSE